MNRAVFFAYFCLNASVLLAWDTINILYLAHSNFCEKENKMRVCNCSFTSNIFLAEILLNQVNKN